MAANQKTLKKDKGGILAPQHFDDKINDYDYVKGTDGASHVRVKKTVGDVTLQNDAIVIGNGTEFAPQEDNCALTFEINGTSTSRTVVFELAGPSGVYQPHTAYNVLDPVKYGPQTTGGSNTAPESWEVNVPAGYKFRARISAVVGGNVTIKGKVVT